MFKIFAKLLLNSIALVVVAYIVPGFEFETYMDVLATAIVLGVVNTFIKPALQILFIPITIITFGLFAIFINVCLLWAVSLIVPGFKVTGFVSALIGSIVLSLVTMFLQKLGDRQ